MKKQWMAALCCGLLILTTGCTQKNLTDISGTVEAKPDFGIKENVEIDWAQIQSDLNDEYVGTPDYEFVKQVDYYVDDSEEDKSLYLMITVADDTDPQAAADLGTSIIKSFGSAVAEQDFSYTPSDDESYGSYFDTYNAWIQVMPESTIDDEDTWLVDDVIVRDDPYMEVQTGSNAWGKWAEQYRIDPADIEKIEKVTDASTEGTEAAGAETTAAETTKAQ